MSSINHWNGNVSEMLYLVQGEFWNSKLCFYMVSYAVIIISFRMDYNEALPDSSVLSFLRAQKVAQDFFLPFSFRPLSQLHNS